MRTLIILVAGGIGGAALAENKELVSGKPRGSCVLAPDLRSEPSVGCAAAAAAAAGLRAAPSFARV
jgi:hypothetical protein